MPAPVSTSTDVKQSNKATNGSFSRSHAKRTRIVRRRGRAPNGIESDDELEREVRTDSESDDDSTLDTESDLESASDDGHANGHSEVVTPSTTQSPPPLGIASRSSLNGQVTVKSHPDSSESGPFIGTTNWAEMVADEHANGAANLPVIDFAEMDSHRIDQPYAAPVRVRKPHKTGRKHAARANAIPSPDHPPTSAPAENYADETTAVQDPSAPTSEYAEHPSQSHHRGPSARQAYQQRLEQDPSYVPTVGEFWGHDDRLLDKDLRSLSGWWRGRWQSRGRGRGGFMRGRGGRGFFPGRPPFAPPNAEEEAATEELRQEVPPIEQTWGHDGFEEMKKRDEHRRTQQQQQAKQQAQSPSRQPPSDHPQRGFGFRGRGGFSGARGRGGFARGGAMSPSGPRRSSFAAMSDRPWFAMKPERVWTKHHESFLYFDIASKPRAGQGTAFRVKLPGAKGQVVRLPPRASSSASAEPVETRTLSTPDQGEKIFNVRIPRRAGKERAAEEPPPTAPADAVVEEAVTTMAELTLEEVFTVRPNAVPNRRVHLEVQPPASTSSTSTPPVFAISPPLPLSAPLSQPVSPASTPRDVSDEPVSMEPDVPATAEDGPSAQVQDTILRNPPTTQSSSSTPEEQPVALEQRHPQPVLPPIQTVFSPPPQPSPTYGSPYAYPPALPPGIAMNQHGMPYELATGRPVYLQPTPPPTMFTPRQMIHTHMGLPSAGVPFVPTHMHHPSNPSPDFLSHPHTPPINTFIDPASGIPIFAPARQSSRIEIRAPTDVTDGRKSIRSSNLRTSVSGPMVYAPSPNPQQPMYYPGYETSSVAVDNGVPPASEPAPPVEQPQVAPMPYPAYQQYYYPEYAYSSYVNPSSQVMQYEMYPSDPQPQPMVYY